MIGGLLALVDELDEEVQSGLILNRGNLGMLIEDVHVVRSGMLGNKISHISLVNSHDDVQSFADVSSGSTDFAKVSLDGIKIFIIDLFSLSLLLDEGYLFIFDFLNDSETLLNHLEEGGQFSLSGEKLSLLSILTGLEAVPQFLVKQLQLLGVLLLDGSENLHGELVIHLVQHIQITVVGNQAVLESLHRGLSNFPGEVGHVLVEDGQDLLGVRSELSAHGLSNL